jgi:formiminotetrahydrofolate cyclodeaminase
VGSAAAALVCSAARDAGDAPAAAQAAALTLRLARLAEADAEALASARDALAGGLGRDPDERRDFALGRALDHAAEVPLQIAEACADVARLAAAFGPDAETASAPDVEAARELAIGAARAAAHLVEVNLGVTEDDERLARARAAAAA